jgi:transcription antitermination factor NusG
MQHDEDWATAFARIQAERGPYDIWVAVYTAPGAERKAQLGLEDLGFGTFLPTYAVTVQRGRKFGVVERPLLPRYILVHLTIEQRRGWSIINEIDGVTELLEVDGNPLEIPEAEVAALTLAHASGEWNKIAKAWNGRYSKRRRRPRLNKKGKRRRVAMNNYLVRGAGG